MEILMLIEFVIMIILLIAMSHYSDRYEKESRIRRKLVNDLYETEQERDFYKKKSLELATELNNKEEQGQEIEELNSKLKDANKKLREKNKEYKDLSKEYKQLKKESDELKKPRILMGSEPSKVSDEKLSLKTKTTEDKKEEKKTTTKRTKKTKKTKEDK